MKRYHITLGAPTTAGGKVTTASSSISINGTRIALEDDKVFCAGCNSEGVIKLDGPRLSERFNGRQVALNDDLCICKCSPPPRLVNSQTHKSQTINAEQFAAKIAATTAQLPAAARVIPGHVAQDDEVPIRLLHPETRQPFRHRPYKLHLTNKVIEGMTDSDGCTVPLSAADRAAVTAWRVDEVSGA